ncbi:MAG TPA: hypothetical protein VHC45_08170 [Gaiellaceae bacterium]|jgi:hypothetical protein|nr:hypothetical protein [Gaiellaceae bacterium]
MRRLSLAALLVLVLAALAVAPALAAPRITNADRGAIGTLVDRFTKDVLLRQDLADGWTLAGPDMKAGTTRAAWLSGAGVTLAAYPAKETSFSKAWTGKLVGPGHAVLAMVLHPKPGTKAFETAFTIDVRKLGGRWVVDLYYPAAIIRAGTHQGSCGHSDCYISGPADFGPLGGATGGGAVGASGNSGKISFGSFMIGIAVVGALIVLTPIAFWLRLKRRDRRAMAAYLATRDQ